MPALKPHHKVAEDTVDVPTLVLMMVGSPGDAPATKQVQLQWFGDASDGPMPDEPQFFFPLGIAADDVQWADQIDTFRVAFVGPWVKWPNRQAAQGLADQLSDGNLEGWAVHLLSGAVTLLYPPAPGTLGPTSFVLPLTAMLADPNCGVITPRPFFDPQVAEEELDRAQQRVVCPGCTLRLHEDDLQGQSYHLIEQHPEILDARLEACMAAHTPIVFIHRFRAPDA